MTKKKRERILSININCFIKMDDTGADTDVIGLDGNISIGLDKTDEQVLAELEAMGKAILKASKEHKKKSKIISAQKKILVPDTGLSLN